MWRVPYVILIVLNALDYWATTQLIARDGYIVEANPFLFTWITFANNTHPIIIAKSIPLAILGICLVWYSHRLHHREKLIRNILWGLNAVIACACIIGAAMLHNVSF